MGDVAPGDGMRLWDDLLAAPQGMARSGCVERAAPNLVGSPRQSRRDRLAEGIVGLGERSSPRGGQKTGKNPTDKGKQGSKRHIVVDREGVPLCVIHTAANIHDSKVLEEAVDAISPIRKPRGRPRKRPKKLHADKAYDFPRCREDWRKRGITPRIARRGIESSEKLGRYRWAVERTLSWVNRFRRLKVRYERREDVHQAFLDLGCALICWRYVQRLC
jgi:transposase